jgi:3D (Asp-Asp-Asp) domain-containing protein
MPPPPPKRAEKEPPTDGVMYWGKQCDQPHVPVSTTQFSAHAIGSMFRMKRSLKSDLTIGGNDTSSIQRSTEFTIPSTDRLVHRPVRPIGGAHEKTKSDVYMTNEDQVRQWYNKECTSMSHRQFVPIALGEQDLRAVFSSKERCQDNQKEMMKSHFPVGTEKRTMYETSTMSQFIDRSQGVCTRPKSAFTAEEKYHSDVPLGRMNVDWRNVAQPTTKATFVSKKIERTPPCLNSTTQKHSWSFGMDERKRFITTTRQAYRGIDFASGPAVMLARRVDSASVRRGSQERNRTSHVPL